MKKDVYLKRYSYSFDEYGIFAGLVKKIEIEPGVFEPPKNSCEIRPVMQDGFKCVWNGYSWDLIANDSPLIVARRLMPGLSGVLNAEKARMLEHVVKISYNTVYDEIMQKVREDVKKFMDGFLLQCSIKRNEIDRDLQTMSLIKDEVASNREQIFTYVTRYERIKRETFWQRFKRFFGIYKHT